MCQGTTLAWCSMWVRTIASPAFRFARAQVYEFEDEDFRRVQALIGELRDLLRDNSLITEEHQKRLLRRLESMRAELHKRTTDIERFWGFLGEAAIVIRKFGEDLKPISERVLELGGIILRVIFAKEGIKALPELNRMLMGDEPQEEAAIAAQQSWVRE